jgi:hypothetical protein
MGPDTPLIDLPSHEFTLKFVKFEQTDSCKYSALKLSDTTVKYPDAVREDELYYAIQNVTNLTDNGMIPLEIPAKQVRSNVTSCTIESSVEMMNEWGWYEDFIGNEFITLDMDP